MKKNNFHLFNLNLNNKLKSSEFKGKSYGSIQATKYLPPVSKEWKNTIYSYYKNNMKNLPIHNINTNKIIRTYFDLYFKNNKFTSSRYIGLKKRRNFLRKIYTSKIETKHTSSKTMITLYTMNIGKNILRKNYEITSQELTQRILKLWVSKFKKQLRKINLNTKWNKEEYLADVKEKNNFFYSKYKDMENKKKLYFIKYKFYTENLVWYNMYLKLYLTRAMKYSFKNKIKQLRNHKYRYLINKFKFENQEFLFKLNKFLSKMFNNRIEFNIVNLKSIALNTDIFTNILALKLKRKNKFSVTKEMNNILKETTLPVVNGVSEKASGIRKESSLLLNNIYKDLSLVNILEKKENYDENNCNLDVLLKKITENNKPLLNINKDDNISDSIFNSIKYKNIGGIRLETKGRLTTRNRADRSQVKVKWKGGLKDIDSSYKRLSTTMYRGYQKSNMISSISSSKRPVGAFAVKGWMSGK